MFVCRKINVLKHLKIDVFLVNTLFVGYFVNNYSISSIFTYRFRSGKMFRVYIC